MINLNFILLFTFLMLVNFNILLLNEETLILVCFLIFCFLITQKLSDLIYNYFNDKKLEIKSNLEKNLEKNFTLLNSNIQINKKVLNWKHGFSNLKYHFTDFNKHLLLNLPILQKNENKLKLMKKFDFMKRLERQSLKLISLILIDKLDKFVTINKFCTTNLKYFSAINKINVREYLRKID